MNLGPLPLGSDVDSYQRQARDVLTACRSGDAEAIRFVRDETAGFDYLHKSEPGEQTSLEDARAALARWYHFEDWATLASWVGLVRDKTSTVAQFESAVEAVVAGDVDTLARLLRENPALVHEVSVRGHRSTLLIYVGANGVEWYRQKTPPNAVAVAQLLLDAGAEIDAVGKMYRGTTTLGLVATSVHPVVTGVQEPLMQLLLDRGASMASAVAPDYTKGLIVNACLANGRPGGAEFLAARGAELNFEGAAGVGRLDVVKHFFDDETLRAALTKEDLRQALTWACGDGRASVVEFLLARGIDRGAVQAGGTALHNAAYGGHADIARMLLARGANVDLKDDTYDATPLGWALYGWMHPSPEAKRARHHEVVELLVAAGASVDKELLDDAKVCSDPRMLAALTNHEERSG